MFGTLYIFKTGHVLKGHMPNVYISSFKVSFFDSILSYRKVKRAFMRVRRYFQKDNLKCDANLKAREIHNKIAIFS